MKRLLIGLTLFAAACSGSSPTSPSGPAASDTLAQSSANPASGPATGPAVDPVPGPTAAAVPQFTLSGPSAQNNCVTAGTDPLQWVLNMTDSGPRHLRFVALAHHDNQPGCDPTILNPRARIQLSGTTDYAPHTSGQTIMTFDPKMYNCGRVQVDVSIFDAQGNEILIIVLVLNYGSICSPPPNTLTCVPPSQTSAVGLPVSFAATGGTGSYSWSAPGGGPASGSGAGFTTSYAAPGTYVATVTSGTATATCSVSIPPPIVSVQCTPSIQTVAIGQPVTIFATGGNGTFAWSAPGGTTTTGSGSPFTTSYLVAGTYNVTVTSAGAPPQTCQVLVPPTPPPLVCAPPLQTVAINAPATVTAAGGTGTYSWSAPNASATSGAGASFITSYPAAGTNTITVTSGGQTATCQVTVPPTPPPLVCAPPTQTVAIGQTANVSATGGTGTFSWSAPGGSTPTGSGASFGTSYPAAGTNTITVTSGAQTATCLVVVPPPTPPLVCAPPTQTVAIGQTANVGATGGNGTYSWSAPGGSTPTGAGASFGTSYPVAGTNTITVTSGAQTATCQVVVPPPPLVCAPPSQIANAGQPVNVGATGGTGAYSWSAPSGSTPTGSGASFTTSYASGGLYTITVTSGAQTAQCQVSVPPPLLSCSGVTASIATPLGPPSGFVTVNVPAGQQASIDVTSLSGPGVPDLGVFNYVVGPGTTVLTVPVSCSPKVFVYCGGDGNTIYANVNGANVCVP